MTKPNNIKIINELVYEQQKLGLGDKATHEFLARQIEDLVEQLQEDNEPEVLYYDDEGQPIHGIEANGYDVPEDELMSWEEIMDNGLF